MKVARPHRGTGGRSRTLPLAASALLLAALAGPGAAQDAERAEVERLRGCLDANAAASEAETEAACVGLVEDACRAGRGETTRDIEACLEQARSAWDRLLNDGWAELRRAAKHDGTFESLLKAQRAWLAFRDAECAHAYEEFAGGSLRTVNALWCLRGLTARRAIAFHRRASQ